MLYIENLSAEPKVILTLNQQQIHLPALWLRERAQDSTQIDLKTKQRLVNPHLMAQDLKIIDANIDTINNTLVINFNDGYHGVYDAAPIISDAQNFNSGLPVIRSWKSNDVLSDTFNWSSLSVDSAVLTTALEFFLQYGYIIIYNTPTEKDSILSIAKRFGYVRDTNFGRYFEVYSKPNANDLAYTSYPIGPHTDNPYRDPVPGIQLLHCLTNKTQGGLSTLVDSISVCDVLKQEDPIGYDLLCSVHVRFRFYDDDTEHVAFHPLIEKDSHGGIVGIHYSPRLDDLPLLDEKTLQSYQSARKRLSELLQDSRFEKRFKLADGELMMFDNNRVLHGRTEFDPNEGLRHLQGCYIDRDGPKSLYRILSKKTNSQLKE